jgi:hypothetical protein
MDRDIMDEDVIKFPCEGCGKILGGHPQMHSVFCARCETTNGIPTREQAAQAMPARHRAPDTDLVDIPLGKLIRFGFKISIAAIPLIVLLMAAACGVYWLIILTQQFFALPE